MVEFGNKLEIMTLTTFVDIVFDSNPFIYRKQIKSHKWIAHGNLFSISHYDFNS